MMLHRLALTAGLAGGLAASCPDGPIGDAWLFEGPPTLLPEAGRGPGTSTTTMTVSGCDFTVTYTWSGFAGKNLIATLGLYNHVPPVDIGITAFNATGQSGKGGTVTQKFSLTPNAYPAGRSIVGRGALEESRKYSQVSGSSSASGAVFSTCG